MTVRNAAREQLSPSQVRKPRANVIGVALDAMSIDEAVATIHRFVATGDPHCVCVCSLQDIVIARMDPVFRKTVNDADLVTADGWPVVWSLRRRGFHQPHRVTGPDLMWALCGSGVVLGHKHFLYGGAASVPDELSQKLGEAFDGIEIVGAYSPPFRPLTDEEEDEVVAMINATEADYVWVGLSTPKQHHWMQRFRSRLNAPVIATVGAAFDFHSGRVQRAPRWMQESGLEWVHRAIKEPRRLGPRYLKFIPQYFGLQIADYFKIRSFHIDDCKKHFGPRNG